MGSSERAGSFPSFVLVPGEGVPISNWKEFVGLTRFFVEIKGHGDWRGDGPLLREICRFSI